jgi:hypothetical protein
MSSPVAVLVDGENIRADFAVQILNAATRHGTPTIRRIYQDAAKQNGWSDMPGWKLVHSGTGKNATDMLLCIEAVDLALIQGITQVVIVSSDGDFSHLATYLREHGTEVIGIGEIKTPRKFSKACSEFINLTLSAAPSDPVPLHAPKPAPKPEPQLSKDDLKIVAVIKQFSDDQGRLRIGELGNRISKEHGIQIKSLSAKNWSTYLKNHPQIYTVTGKGATLSVQLTKAAIAATGT